jgi:hypothetical protein
LSAQLTRTVVIIVISALLLLGLLAWRRSSNSPANCTDFRIPHSRVANVGEDEFFWAVIEPIWPATEKEDTPNRILSGTPGQQALYGATLFIREVDNGGLQQFLWNMKSWYVDLAVKSLERIEAKEHADAFRRGIRAYFGDNMPDDLALRRRIIDGKTAEWREVEIEPLNKQLYGEERLYPYFRQYIERYPDQFFLD